MKFNTLRTAKIKDRQQITEAAEHNFRIRTQENVDPKRTHLNQILVNTLNVDTKKAGDLQKKLTKHYDSLGIKEKKTNVLMLEFVVSTSNGFFEEKSPSQIDEWATAQVEFFKKEFGEQLKIAVLHLDETTPHIHFMIGTEIKSVKKYKNQKGECHKETWSLNADRYDPAFLIGLHDRHAEANKKFGLRRGVPGSLRKHTTLKEFYDIVDKAMNTDYDKVIENVIESMETGLMTGKVTIDEVREKFKPMLNGVLKQNKVLRAKYALDIKKWASDLSIKEIELEVKQMEMKSLKPLYSEAVKTKIADRKLIDEQQAKLNDVMTENKRLKEQYQPEKFEFARKVDEDPVRIALRG